MKTHGLIAAVVGCMASTAWAAGAGDVNAKCEQALNRANYKIAGPACQAALSASQSGEPEQHVRALVNLSSFYSDRGQDADAAPLIQKALDIEQDSSAGTGLQGRNLVDLAILLQEESRYAESEAAFKRALEIQEKTSGPDSKEVGTTLTYLGVLLREQHKFDKAIPMFQRALDIDEKKFGPHDPTTEVVRNDLQDVSEQAKTSPVIRYNNTPQVVSPTSAPVAPAQPANPTAPAMPEQPSTPPAPTETQAPAASSVNPPAAAPDGAPAAAPEAPGEPGPAPASSAAPGP